MTSARLIRDTLAQGQGILQLMPVFVPRRFSAPGRRLRLHPDDYFALGTNRGAIKERWFASVIKCMNGPLAAKDEGLSYVLPKAGPAKKFTLRDAQEELGAELVGAKLMKKYGGWPMYSKFFDFGEPLFHHLHLDFKAAARVGALGKPEAYYFPPQLNNHLGTFPATYFGFDPDVTKAQVKERLAGYTKGDTRITELSRAYRIALGSGWYTPPGVVHAPGSVLTYEPQWNADVNSVYENIAAGEVYPYEFLVENCPKPKKLDLDYVISLMDWEKNVDPHYARHYARPPIRCPHSDKRHEEKWISYANPYVGAKELTVQPGQTVTVKDGAAYGCIAIQGHGTFGGFQCDSSGMLRYGQLTNDEYFVSEPAAKVGVTITCNSRYEPLVILKHFGPNHPEMPKAADLGLRE
jgi:hypothetical protein